MQKGFTPILILVGILVITVVAAGAYFGAKKNIIPLPFKQSPKVCIQDAKQCPDGSYVGRSGPNCEFKACPDKIKLKSCINAFTRECKELSDVCTSGGDWLEIKGCSKKRADWVEFKDERHKLTFSYPPYFIGGFDGSCGGFDAGEPDNADCITFLEDPYYAKADTDAPFNGIQIYAVTNVGDISFEQYKISEKQRLLQLWKTVAERKGESALKIQLEQSAITIGNREGVVFKGMYEDRDLYYVPVSGTNTILLIAKLEESPGSFNPLFDQILSTFKFTQ